jgi:hypothetical protein
MWYTSVSLAERYACGANRATVVCLEMKVSDRAHTPTPSTLGTYWNGNQEDSISDLDMLTEKNILLLPGFELWSSAR